MHSLPRHFGLSMDYLRNGANLLGHPSFRDVPVQRPKRILTGLHVSCILYHVSCVMCLLETVMFFFWKSRKGVKGLAHTHTHSPPLFVARLNLGLCLLSSRHRAHLEMLLLWLRNRNVLVILPSNMDTGTNTGTDMDANTDTPSRNSYLGHRSPFFRVWISSPT